MQSGPALILTTLDRYLTAPGEVRLFDGAALILGYGRARQTEDADLLLDDAECQALIDGAGFSEAVEATNAELKPRGLYLTHCRRRALRPGSERLAALPGQQQLRRPAERRPLHSVRVASSRRARLARSVRAMLGCGPMLELQQRLEDLEREAASLSARCDETERQVRSPAAAAREQLARVESQLADEQARLDRFTAELAPAQRAVLTWRRAVLLSASLGLFTFGAAAAPLDLPHAGVALFGAAWVAFLAGALRGR